MSRNQTNIIAPDHYNHHLKDSQLRLDRLRTEWRTCEQQSTVRSGLKKRRILWSTLLASLSTLAGVLSGRWVICWRTDLIYLASNFLCPGHLRGQILFIIMYIVKYPWRSRVIDIILLSVSRSMNIIMYVVKYLWRCWLVDVLLLDLKLKKITDGRCHRHFVNCNWLQDSVDWNCKQWTMQVFETNMDYLIDSIQENHSLTMIPHYFMGE